MAREKIFENEIKKFLQSLPNCWYFKVFGGGFQKAGIPDILACVNGVFVAIEVKAENGTPSALQKRNIRLINEAGGIGYILYPCDFEKFKTEIRRIC